ncbi:MAG: putative toxin-antitoxin system toxin component, PIN family [Christensenellales bacterium]
MKCYAVVDTNVIVSALITKNPDSPPRQVFRAMLTGDIVPLYHPDILAEYEEVLCPEKVPFAGGNLADSGGCYPSVRHRGAAKTDGRNPD